MLQVIYYFVQNVLTLTKVIEVTTGIMTSDLFDYLAGWYDHSTSIILGFFWLIR